MNEYGMLTDYTTGEEIRPATRDEWERSTQAAETGAFQIDTRTLFVAGGGEPELDAAIIADK